ncbi:unnamed protein product [Rotaria sp. Silwood1]|nr:unnamed protein product [Rotaria sp. Silwood1]CAF1612479.1 unnamed protein product [Rotaria sp. Silwood1]
MIIDDEDLETENHISFSNNNQNESIHNNTDASIESASTTNKKTTSYRQRKPSHIIDSDSDESSSTLAKPLNQSVFIDCFTQK